MSEKSKYYIPTIEEFHVGFEYQEATFHEDIHQATDYFQDKILTEETSLKSLKYAIQTNDVRVKYLDRENIESLGWKEYSSNDFLMIEIGEELVEGVQFRIAHKNPECEYSIILYKNMQTVISFITQQKKSLAIFSGTIKNKSELKRLMQQLGIQ